MNFGEKIRFLRESRGLTQEELAKKVNVTQSMIAQLERGTKVLTVPMAHMLAEIFGVPITDIV